MSSQKATPRTRYCDAEDTNLTQKTLHRSVVMPHVDYETSVRSWLDILEPQLNQQMVLLNTIREILDYPSDSPPQYLDLYDNAIVPFLTVFLNRLHRCVPPNDYLRDLNKALERVRDYPTKSSAAFIRWVIGFLLEQVHKIAELLHLPDDAPTDTFAKDLVDLDEDLKGYLVAIN